MDSEKSKKGPADLDVHGELDCLAASRPSGPLATGSLAYRQLLLRECKSAAQNRA